jgi:hypothetical protein
MKEVGFMQMEPSEQEEAVLEDFNPYAGVDADDGRDF